MLRIFKEILLWFGSLSLLVSEVPIIGSAPALTLIRNAKMFSTQIKIGKS